MLTPDICALRQTFMQERILLSFNGPFTESLIDEIGSALREHMLALVESPSAITDVFSMYIEMTQNIRRYTMEHDLQGAAASAIIVVSRDSDGVYTVSAGNMVYHADGERLLARAQSLQEMDKVALKAAFKAQLRQPRDTSKKFNGAGLGLIDMARKATFPLRATLTVEDTDFSFFSLHASL